MNNDFDTDFEAAFQELRNDPQESELDIVDLALKVHRDRLIAYQAEIDVRGSVGDLEIKGAEAYRQALLAYTVLYVRRLYELQIMVLTRTHLSTEEGLKGRADVLKTLYTELSPLDHVESLARQTLIGLGLPGTIDEFAAYDGNCCRMDIDLSFCVLVVACI
jgi:hypothetical protein